MDRKITVMNCETAEESLLDYLEGQLDAGQTEAMRAHIDNCPTCRRALRETRELIDAIDHARRKQEHAWKHASRADTSVREAADRAKSFTFAPGQLLGDFEIINEIGRGGMGVVYRARQITLNRVVALKVLPANIGQTESAIHRFVREAQAAAKLHHTNIVPVYSQGEADGHFYYAMEFIDGPNLGRLMKDDRSAILSGLDAVALSGAGSSSDLSGISRLDGSGPRRRADYRRIAGLIASVADALEHAHRMNVIHRDIKPQNLLLGNDGEFHITDFGLARLLDEPNMTVTGEMLGTPAYMSPEQVDADRERIDARTDIYSLGVTLYELLTGKRPFDGTSREQVIARVRDREPMAPRKHDPNIPIDLDTICLRAMEKSPNRRYQSAEALAADLRRFAENKPIHARRVGPIEKGIKWIRRHPAKFTIAMLVLVMIVGGIVWDAQIRADRRQRADGLVADAIELLAVEDYRRGDDARSLLLEAAPMGADEASMQKATGLSYVMSNPDKAEAPLLRALALRPDDTETMYILAWAMRRMNRDDESNKWIERADKLGGPTTDYGYFFRATARVREHPDEAEADYDRANAIRNQTKKKGYYQAMVHSGRAKNTRMYHTRSPDDFSSIEQLFGGAIFQKKDDPYAHYLMSLANRIRGEIYADSGMIREARLRFAMARMNAEDAIKVGAKSPRGYAALAEFWESVSDRNQQICGFGNKSEKERAVKTLSSDLENAGQSGESSPGDLQTSPTVEWLDVSSGDALRRAVEARTAGLHRCRTDDDVDRREFLQYRLLDYFWLGEVQNAKGDCDVLNSLTLQTDKFKLRYEWLIPMILASEQESAPAALKSYGTVRDVAANQVDYRRASLVACGFHLLGDAGGARSFLDKCVTRVDFKVGLNEAAPDDWWRNAWRILAEPDFSIDADWPGMHDGDKLYRAPAYFFRGVVALGAGNRELALRSLKACESCYDYEDYGYLARMLRRRLQMDSTWPEWIKPAHSAAD